MMLLGLCRVMWGITRVTLMLLRVSRATPVIILFYFIFGFGATPTPSLMGYIGCQGIEPGSSACRAKALPAVLSLWPTSNVDHLVLGNES